MSRVVFKNGYSNKLPLVVIIILLSLQVVLGDKLQAGDPHFWGNYTLYKEVNNNWQVSSRFECRYTDFSESKYRLGFSPEVKYAATSLVDLQLGSRFFSFHYQDLDNESEFRPWLGVKIKQPLNEKFDLNYTGKWENLFSSDEEDFESRLRFGVKLGYELYDSGEQHIQIGFAPEMFFSLGEYDVFSAETIRWVVPITYKHSNRWTYELMPAIETSHTGIFSSPDSKYAMFRFNIKTYL